MVAAVDVASGQVVSQQTFEMVAADAAPSLRLEVAGSAAAGQPLPVQVSALDALGETDHDLHRDGAAPGQ